MYTHAIPFFLPTPAHNDHGRQEVGNNKSDYIYTRIYKSLGWYIRMRAMEHIPYVLKLITDQTFGSRG